MFEEYKSNNPICNATIKEAMDLGSKLVMNGIAIDKIAVQVQTSQFGIGYMPLTEVQAAEPKLTDSEPVHLLFQFSGRESYSNVGMMLNSFRSGYFSEVYCMALLLDQIRKGV